MEWSPTPGNLHLPGRVFQLSYSGGVSGTNSRVPTELLRVDSPTPFPGVDGPTPGTLQRVRPAAGVRCPADPLKSPQQYPREVLLHAGVGVFMILQSVNAPTAGPTLPLTGQASAGSHTCPLTRQQPGSSPLNLVAACQQAKTWPVANKAQDTTPLTTTALPLHAYTHRRSKGVARRKRH